MFFFFNDTATTEIYTLTLHDALPICPVDAQRDRLPYRELAGHLVRRVEVREDLDVHDRSEEHTSELQSRLHLVCRLLLEKKTNRLLSRQQPPWISHKHSYRPAKRTDT